jgi:hypothetical protein
MKATYTRKQGRMLTYEIETDRRGGYTIRREGKLLRTVVPPSDYFGKSRYGSKAQEAEALKLAQGDIELLMGMDE